MMPLPVHAGTDVASSPKAKGGEALFCLLVKSPGDQLIGSRGMGQAVGFPAYTGELATLILGEIQVKRCCNHPSVSCPNY